MFFPQESEYIMQDMPFDLNAAIKRIQERASSVCYWCHCSLVEPRERAQGVHKECQDEASAEFAWEAKVSEGREKDENV